MNRIADDVQQNAQVCQDLYQTWKAEDEVLDKELSRVVQWMKEVNQLGKPRFGETGARLKRFRNHLVDHFQRERELADGLAKCYAPSSPEVAASRRQAEHDHENLLSRLDDLIDRLMQWEPPFESWSAAMNEVDLFLVALEQHEDYEDENVRTLLPMTDFRG